MRSKIVWLSWLAATLNLAPALADAATPSAPAAAPGGIRISIKNEYVANLNFGVLGKGSRSGTDRAEGELSRQENDYVGVVNAVVESSQGMSGLGGNCGPARYEDSQKLRVIGHAVSGFNDVVQSPTFTAGSPGSEYLVLEFVPETPTTTQPPNRDPYQDTIVNCHTLIETEATIDSATGTSSILFLPLNDSRWTMKGGGYIIALPSSGVLEYTDTQVAGTTTMGPFQVQKSIWTIRVERSSGSPASLPAGCVEVDPNDPANRARPQPGEKKPPCPPPPSSPQAP